MTEKSVFLFPFAGGSSMLYSQWRLKQVRFCPIEYGGHGFRYREPMARTMDELMADAIRQIERVDTMERYLFGHSMGGLIAWLAAQRMKAPPKALFVSACEPPGCIDTKNYDKYQNADNLDRYIADYGHISQERRESAIFRNILLPVVRNDLRLLSEYVYEPAAPLDVPIVVFYSKEDIRTRYELMGKWKEYGTDVRFVQMSGDHFYLEDEQNRRQILAVMEKVMTDV